MKLHLYQAKNGSIRLVVDHHHIALTLEQVKTLNLTYSKLDNFNWNELIKYYSL